MNRTEAHINTLIQSVFKDRKWQLPSILASILHEIATPADQPPKPTVAETRTAERLLKEGNNEPSLINDPDFIADLAATSSTIPVLREAITAAKDQAQKYLETIVDKLCRTLLLSTQRIQLEDIQAQVKLDAERRGEKELRDASRSLIEKINSLWRSCESP